MNEEVILSLGARLRLAGGPEGTKGMVLICPGGGYSWLSPREADPVARAFQAGGWSAAVLYYTVRSGADQPPLGDLPARQVAQAANWLRQKYPDERLVLCGFSAGGHLAASYAARWSQLDGPRPDGLILGYPVITAGTYTHRGTMEALAGDRNPSAYGIEGQVTGQMPPVFLWHTVTDPEVPVQNSLLLAGALSQAGVPYELHLYPRGVHGLSLATPEVEEPEKSRFADEHIAGWFSLCLAWLDSLLTE